MATRRVTLAAVNAAIKAAGGAEKLVAGKDYYYFTDGDAMAWSESGVYGVRLLSEMTVEQWVGEWRAKRDAANRFKG